MSFDRKQYMFILEDRVDCLEKENFALEANQCPFRDGSGLCGDEGGNQYCAKDRELTKLRDKKPMTKDEVLDLLHTAGFDTSVYGFKTVAFILVRAVESFHKIGKTTK